MIDPKSVVRDVFSAPRLPPSIHIDDKDDFGDCSGQCRYPQSLSSVREVKHLTVESNRT